MEEQLLSLLITQNDSGISLNGWNLLMMACIYLVSVVVSPFLIMRAKNLATQKDVREITSQIEQVKLEFSRILENHQQKHRLALAAIEPRLKAHQEAFTHWKGIFQASREGGDQLHERIKRAEAWLDKNIIYLSNDVASSMRLAMGAAPNRKHALQYSDNDTKNENWNQMIEAEQVILDAVALPGFLDDELQPIEKSGHYNE